jgi:two-component system, OmpR family, sensor histidine kinase BaeS
MRRLHHRVLKAWLLCMMLFAFYPIYAMPVIEVDQELSRKDKLRDFEFLRDDEHKWTVDDIRKLPAERFGNLHGTRLNQRFSKADFWLRTSVHNSAPVTTAWVMLHKLPLTDYVEYWIFKDGKLAMHAIGGDRTLLSERQIAYHFPAVRYISEPGETVQVYIRLHNVESALTYLDFSIHAEKNFIREMDNEQLVLGVLYGIPLALALSTLAGWLIAGIRSGQVPVYVVYVLSVLGSWLCLNGQFAQYVVIDRPSVANSMAHIFLLMVSASMSVFAIGFLRTKELMPKFDLYFRCIVGTAVFGMILRFAGVYTFVTQLSVVLSVFSIGTPFAAAIAWRNGVVYARWYFFAQLLYSGSITAGIFAFTYDHISFNYLFYCELSFFGELLLLGVAQQDRMRFLKTERVQVEQQYKAALEESNAELEREVYERTRTLQEAYKRTQFLSEVKVATRRIADGEFSVRLQEGEGAGMRDLAESVNSMAESLSRLEGARRRWIAEISHELRTPLFALMCETEALLDGVRTLNKRAIGSLHEEILRLSLLVSDLHELALSYLRPLPCTFTTWRLDDVAHKLTKRYIEQARTKGLEFKLKIHDCHHSVTWDKGRIEQLLSNLVQNSISYTDAPGKIILEIAVMSSQALINIEDSPPGVSAEEAQRLFEPLYRADTARSRRLGGSGLGLSICQAIVHAHSGRIMAARSSMGGLAIRIDLPLVIEENGR